MLQVFKSSLNALCHVPSVTKGIIRYTNYTKTFVFTLVSSDLFILLDLHVVQLHYLSVQQSSDSVIFLM